MVLVYLVDRLYGSVSNLLRLFASYIMVVVVVALFQAGKIVFLRRMLIAYNRRFGVRN